jgi:hypothetical protein
MILVAVSIAALFSFAVIAIDGSIMQTTKTELQNGADAAALAGAMEYAITGGNETLAKDMAVKFAAYNMAVETVHTPIDILPADVEIDTDQKTVTVTTYRTQDHGDPLRTYFLKIFDIGRLNLVDVRARATAEVFDVCDVQCVKPWAVPDRWDDTSGPNPGKYDTGDPFDDLNGNYVRDAGEPYTDKDGNGVYTPPEFYDPLLTGYNAPGDVGTTITLKVGNPNQAIEPGHFFPIDLPPLHKGIAPITGGDAYREWIRTCAPYNVGPGDSLQIEPGNMVGPTSQGMADLIAQDPDAYWDGTQVVSDFGRSPRIVLVPFFIPISNEGSGRNNVIVSKVGAFFLEEMSGGDVVGRFIKVAFPGVPCDDPATTSFIVGLHLIENP